MFTHIFQELGLAKNEAQIYETLLRESESSAGEIAVKSKVHRRNVYDSLRKLQERGLVFEVQLKRESRYQAVDPEKLMDLVREKQQKLEKIMPELQELYTATPKEQAVYIYHGIEGWKNYMRDIIRLGEDYYCIAGKGAWMDPRNLNFFTWFEQELIRKEIGCYVLFDYEVKEHDHEIQHHVGPHYRFFPEGFSSPASVEIFGDRVNLVTNIHFGGLDKDFSFTVIINEQLADAFRIWFKFMWESCAQ